MRPLLVAVLALSACVACDRLDAARDDAPRAGAPLPAPVLPEAPPPLAQLPAGASIADVAARVTPSVVTVFSERAVEGLGGLELVLPGGGELRQRGMGSGVIVDAEGIVVTNHHVIAGADAIRIALEDGRELAANVVGSDPQSDLAVLRVQDAPRGDGALQAIELADSSRLRIGDVVLAVGNPFGIGQTVTMGIISAVGRANMGLADYEDFIQTDAAINPGNSGGALVDMAGRLVGIPTAIATRSGGSQGIGFAIPSAMVVQVKDSILAHGRVVRGWLGVSIQDVDAELARALELPDRRGVLVAGVDDEGPAARAGLRRGDLIVAIDGAPTPTSAQLRNQVAFAGQGARVDVTLVRGGVERHIAVTLEEAPDDALAAGEPVDDGALAGIAVAPLDADARRRARLPAAVDGVVVTRAPRGGLLPGDVVLEVNRAPTPTVAAFAEAARAAGDRALVLVQRRGTTMFLLVALR